MRYWLFKSEPSVFSIEHLKNSKSNPWDGVRNYQARNYMRDDVKIGDKCFFYHSNCKIPGIVGEMVVSRESFPDFTSWDSTSKYYDPKSTSENPRWFMVEVTHVQTYSRVISLSELKEYSKNLKDFRLIQTGNRLSILPVEEEHWKFIKKLL